MYFSCLDHFFLLLMQALLFCNTRENQLHDIDVRSCYQALSTCFVKVLLAFHTFPGCDQTETFEGTVETTLFLGWYVLSRYQLEIVKLPSKEAFIKYKIFKYHFLTLVFRT